MCMCLEEEDRGEEQDGVVLTEVWPGSEMQRRGVDEAAWPRRRHTRCAAEWNWAAALWFWAAAVVVWCAQEGHGEVIKRKRPRIMGGHAQC